MTLTDVVKDPRYKEIPGDLAYLGTQEYQNTLKIGSNMIQVFLYLDLNAREEQFL